MKPERQSMLDKITALIREEKDLRDTMEEMTEQCDRIRKYCLDALDDMEASMNTIGDLIASNKELFPELAHSTICAVMGNNGASFQVSFIANGWVLIDKVYAYNPSRNSAYEVGGGGEQGRTLSGYGFADTASFNDYRKRITEEKRLQTLMELQKDADTTKDWISALFDILKQNLENRVATLHMNMKDGIHAASRNYKRES